MSVRYSKAEAAGQRCMMFEVPTPAMAQAVKRALEYVPAPALAASMGFKGEAAAVFAKSAEAMSTDELYEEITGRKPLKCLQPQPKVKKAKAAVQSSTLSDLVAAVRVHAHENYTKDGWDFVVECWEDSAIAETIGKARTVKAAIAKVRAVVRDQAENRASVESEVF